MLHIFCERTGPLNEWCKSLSHRPLQHPAPYWWEIAVFSRQAAGSALTQEQVPADARSVSIDWHACGVTRHAAYFAPRVPFSRSRQSVCRRSQCRRDLAVSWHHPQADRFLTEAGDSFFIHPRICAQNQCFRIIFFAIPSATVRSESGMNGLLPQPGRDEEGLYLPGSHRVTVWAAISFSSRAVSSSRVSPSKTRLLAFRMRRGCTFLSMLIKVSPNVKS